MSIIGSAHGCAALAGRFRVGDLLGPLGFEPRTKGL
jgi:hypothetical protein